MVVAQEEVLLLSQKMTSNIINGMMLEQASTFKGVDSNLNQLRRLWKGFRRHDHK
ncbi:hypothetical protein M413DRAFT_232869 [Hebeloma cylindrosporum]|uniref:Uncharacterized protein n=1 Tax=Hebeloma cylindrosporum TaxID=76867 RepID=A0A0C3CWE8_HEBCY|nr:hypothetical protein M413DRAFT_232869 [Hebeloma cylindrosporum h7]